MSDNIMVRIVNHGAFRVVGTSLFGNPLENAFCKAWDVFGQIADETSWMRRKRRLYGLQIYPPRYPKPFEFTYLAGVQATAGIRTPLRCVEKELPPSQYAVFDVKGGPKGIDEVYRRAYKEWLPSSNYVQAFPYDFEEYYRSADPEADPVRISVLIPVKKKRL